MTNIIFSSILYDILIYELCPQWRDRERQKYCGAVWFQYNNIIAQVAAMEFSATMTTNHNIISPKIAAARGSLHQVGMYTIIILLQWLSLKCVVGDFLV